jgi:hypothetical protein
VDGSKDKAEADDSKDTTAEAAEAADGSKDKAEADDGKEKAEAVAGAGHAMLPQRDGRANRCAAVSCSSGCGVIGAYFFYPGAGSDAGSAGEGFEEEEEEGEGSEDEEEEDEHAVQTNTPLP